jgi:hypothetical protein
MDKKKKVNYRQKTSLIILICASLLYFYWYNQDFSKEIIKKQDVKSLSLEGKLLIAASNSPFKDSIKGLIIDHYKSTSVIVEVIPIKNLTTKDITDFDAILILHRWEAGKPTEIVQSFIENNTSSKDRMVMLTTSWNGLEKMKNADAITGASIIENVPSFSDRIIKKLNPLLQ